MILSDIAVVDGPDRAPVYAGSALHAAAPPDGTPVPHRDCACRTIGRTQPTAYAGIAHMELGLTVWTGQELAEQRNRALPLF